MKYEYRIQVYRTPYGLSEYDFVCTQRQIDKVFYALAFASPRSNIACVRLFRAVRSQRNGSVEFESVNTFTTKSAAQMLTNWVAERILTPIGEK